LFDFVTRAPRYWKALVMDYAMPDEVMNRIGQVRRKGD
jgi:hypothetical protein